MSEPLSSYTDLNGLSSLRLQAKRDERAALHEASKQFEAIFIQKMLKSMRAATEGERLFSGSQSEFYRDLHDKELSIQLAESGGLGLAEEIESQIAEQRKIGSPFRDTRAAIAERQGLPE